MAEEVSFKVCGFNVELHRDPEYSFNVIFKISRDGWKPQRIFKFFKQHIGEFQDYVQDYAKLNTSGEWWSIHRFLRLFSSYFRDGAELGDRISIGPQDIEMIFLKPNITEQANIFTGIIRFTPEAREALGRDISLAEAKEIFVGLFNYVIVKEGLEALMKLR